MVAQKFMLSFLAFQVIKPDSEYVIFFLEILDLALQLFIVNINKLHPSHAHM